MRKYICTPSNKNDNFRKCLLADTQRQCKSGCDETRLVPYAAAIRHARAEVRQATKGLQCWIDAFVRLQKSCYGDGMNTHLGLSKLVKEYEEAQQAKQREVK